MLRFLMSMLGLGRKVELAAKAAIELPLVVNARASARDIGDLDGDSAVALMRAIARQAAERQLRALRDTTARTSVRVVIEGLNEAATSLFPSNPQQARIALAQAARVGASRALLSIPPARRGDALVDFTVR